MAQRRNSSGREDDLSDVKALAAKARETGGPVLKPNPAELSGVRARRDSVIGMRLTPPPRATSSELPNWFWGVLGCLSVLLVGFAGLFFLGRSGKLAPLLGQAASLVTPPAAPPEAPVAPTAPVAKEPEAPAPAEHAGATDHAARAEHVHAHTAAPPAGRAEPAAAAPSGTPEAAPAAADNAPPPAAADDTAKRAARAPKVKASKEGEAPAAAADDSAGGDTPEAKAGAARPARAAAPAAKAAADDSDDDQALPGQDDVERALDALAPRVRGCFVKYQIKGTARVRLVATAAGKAESVNVTGDFEDTPTGLCVESVLSEAKLPTFKGPPLKLSQSYQLR